MFLFLTLVVCTFSETNAESVLKNIRISAHDGDTRLVLDLSKQTKYKIFTLNQPNRVVIDLYKASKIRKLESTRNGKGLINIVRIAKNNPTKLRVVVETKDLVLYQAMTIPASSEQDFRLVVDVKSMYEGSKKIATSNINQSKMIIAIDPGHGGKDPGTAGKNIVEKHLVLKIAKRLVNTINAEKSMSAFLTRDGDYFPCPQNKKSCDQKTSLNERLDKAKKAGAVLFISIHADAFRDPGVRGATVYALSDAAKVPTDGEWLAMHHVKRYSRATVQLSQGTNEVTAFDQSLVVADAVMKELKKVTRMRKLSVKQAAFVVLKSNEMASILIETSYLSNPGDEKFLINPINQQKIAEAILKGIKHYTTESRKGVVRIN